MLIKGLCAMSLLWWTLAQANWNRVKYVNVRVNVTGRQCTYDNHSFTDKMNLNETCEERWCYPNKKTVILLTCKDPKPGCHFKKGNKKFPKCCKTKCHKPRQPCVIKGTGDLLPDGQIRNSTDPCVRYECHNGNLTVTKCDGADDKRCESSFANKTEPYPACCGPATACVK
uniref:Putative kDa family member n=1 Tax=Rhipicephalus microplus TaxID=6941 RepID=A0A6G5A7K7_RHIMP